MQRVTVTFDLVFDLRRIPGSSLRGRRSLFSFMAGGQTERELQMQGWPRLQVGDTITAVLRRKDKWHTLVGWVNHTTGEIVAPSPIRTLRRSVLLAIGVGVLMAVLYSMLTVNVQRTALGGWAWLLWVGYGGFLIALISGMLLRQWSHLRTARMLEAFLLELRDQPAPADSAAVPDVNKSSMPDPAARPARQRTNLDPSE